MKKCMNFLLSLTIMSGLVFSTGCGDKKQNTKTTDDLPYGATMQVNKENLPFAIEFDKRFITDDEATAIVNYFHAVETNDISLAEKASYQPYITSLSRSSGFDSIQDFLISLDTTIASEYLKVDDYSYSHITVTSCSTKEDKDVYTYFDELDQMLVTAESENSSAKDIIASIDNRKLLSLEITCDVDGESVSLTELTGEQQVYVYTIDGQAYVL